MKIFLRILISIVIMCIITIPLDYCYSGFLTNLFMGIWEVICFIALCLFGFWVFAAIEEKSREKSEK